MSESTKRVLVFGGGGVHDFRSGCPILQEYLEQDLGLTVDYVVEDYDVFLAERMAAYDLAVLYHTGGELTGAQASGLTQWVASGKGFVGVHSAADSFKANPEYIAMLGGVFIGHPCRREYIVSLVDHVPGIVSHIDSPVTRDIEGYTAKDWENWPIFEYKVFDEQYLVDYDPRVDVVANALFKGTPIPTAWTKPWGEGRVFYLALGDVLEVFRNPIFKQLFVNGSRWALEGEAEEEA